MRLLERIHESHLRVRRARRLAARLATEIPSGAKCLDVGSGGGEVAHAIMAERRDITLEGIDVAAREDALIPLAEFDGSNINEADSSYDVVMFVDVLHHVDVVATLLAEAARVSRKYVIIKDHLADDFLAKPILAFMDDIGNRRFNVPLPSNYLTKAEWERAFLETGLKVDAWHDSLGIYPWPASLVLDRRMHFLARLTVE